MSASQSKVIYETVLTDFAQSCGMQRMAIRAVTDPVGPSPFPIGHKEHALYEAVLNQSAGVALDQTVVTPNLNVTFVSEAEVRAAQGNNWSEFIEQYPDAQGLTRVSSIGFEPVTQRTMLIISKGFDWIGTSVAYVLEKSGGQWHVADKHWLVWTIWRAS